MIVFLLLIQIASAIEAYHHTDYEKAYNIAHSIETDTLKGFDYYETIELQAYTATGVRKFEEADSLFKIVFECEYDSILRKAYTNYADLQYQKINFDRRLEYLQKAYHIEPTPQLIRIIARHHFQIRADYETAKLWIDRHNSKTHKDSVGFALLRAEFNESKRQYDQAIEYYSKAKIGAQEANLFNYELFAAEGLYRSKRLAGEAALEKLNNWLYYVIFIVVFYIMTQNREKIRAYVSRKQPDS